MLQRHLLFPSLADLQVEYGQSLQSAGKLQIGSNGGSQTISTSSVTSDEILELEFLGLVKLNGNDWFSHGFPPPLTWIKKIRVFGSIPVTRYVPLGALKLTWPEVVSQSKLKYIGSPQFDLVLSG
jgi:hypothetical protein